MGADVCPTSLFLEACVSDLTCGSDAMLGEPHVVSFSLDCGPFSWECSGLTPVPCGFFPEAQAYGTFVLCHTAQFRVSPELQTQGCPWGGGWGDGLPAILLIRSPTRPVISPTAGRALGPGCSPSLPSMGLSS